MLSDTEMFAQIKHQTGKTTDEEITDKDITHFLMGGLRKLFSPTFDKIEANTIESPFFQTDPVGCFRCGKKVQNYWDVYKEKLCRQCYGLVKEEAKAKLADDTKSRKRRDMVPDEPVVVNSKKAAKASRKK